MNHNSVLFLWSLAFPPLLPEIIQFLLSLELQEDFPGLPSWSWALLVWLMTQQNWLLLCFWKGFLKTEQHLWTPETSKAYSWDTLWNSFLNSNSLRFALLKFTIATLLSWKWMEILYFGRYGYSFGQNCPYKNRQVLSEISENICNCISDVMTRWLFHLKMDTYFCLEIKWL